MAVDTMCLVSPPIPEETARAIEAQGIVRTALDLRVGELVYELVDAPLSGTWDSRISCRVERERWVSTVLPDGRVHTSKRRSEPYVRLEASVHKAMLGHNLWGGPEDPVLAGRWLVRLVERLLGVQLPLADEWEVHRLDWAEVYDLGSVEAVREYIRALLQAEYPRRSAHRYGDTGLYFPGQVTTLKMYAKGPDFWRHDRPRLRQVRPERELALLQEEANRLLRVEVEIRGPKWRYHWGRYPQLREVSAEWCAERYVESVSRVLRTSEVEAVAERVRTAEAVERRLREVYGSRLGGQLYATWTRLATFGEARTREQMSRATFYRHRRLLVDAGCDWHGSDLVLRQWSTVPADFVPLPTDPRRVVGEAPGVREALLALQVA